MSARLMATRFVLTVCGHGDFPYLCDKEPGHGGPWHYDSGLNAAWRTETPK